MSTIQTMERYVIPPVLSGAIAYLGTRYGLNSNSVLDIMGYNLTSAQVVGLCTAVGSLGTEVVAGYLLDLIKDYIPDALANPSIYEPIITGSLSFGVLKFGSIGANSGLSDITPLKGGLISAGSDVLGRYTFDQLVFPMLQ